MRVVDCLEESFSAHCHALSELTGADYSPDLVVAVREGGVHVAREMLAHQTRRVEMITVSAHRQGTAVKRRLNMKVLTRLLPRLLANWLRILEHHGRVGLSTRTPSRPPTVRVSDAASARVAGSERILVVDDAVDSGTTLAAVVRHLAALGGAEIRTAVLTVTFPRPTVLPDYSVYQHGVLLRFPWSDDASGPR